MQVTINGECRSLDSPLSLADVIEQLELGGRRIAIEHNGTIVPRSRYAATVIAEADKLEIVVAVGGG